VDPRSNGELSRGAFVTDFRGERHRRGCGGWDASRVGVGPPCAADGQPDCAGSRYGGGDRGAVGSVGFQAADRSLRLWPSVLGAGPAVDCPDRVSRRFGAGPVRGDRAGSGGSGRFRGVALGSATHTGGPGGMPSDWCAAGGRHAGPGQRPWLGVGRRPGNAGRCRTVGGVPRSGRRGHGDCPPADAGGVCGSPSACTAC
jgi:hypothetical protein